MCSQKSAQKQFTSNNLKMVWLADFFFSPKQNCAAFAEPEAETAQRLLVLIVFNRSLCYNAMFCIFLWRAVCSCTDLERVKQHKLGSCFICLPLALFLSAEWSGACFITQEHSQHHYENISHFWAKNASARPLCRISPPSLLCSDKHMHIIRPTQRGTALHHWALHANMCNCLSPVGRKGNNGLACGGGGQEGRHAS